MKKNHNFIKYEKISNVMKYTIYLNMSNINESKKKYYNWEREKC